MSAYATREEHPLPAVLMHGVHLVSMVLLAFSGFYIHHPFFAGGMSAMRSMHFVSMFVLVLTAVVRVYWAFLGRGSAEAGSRVLVPDYRHFGPEKANRGQMLETLKYYLFLRSTHPRTAKYNTLQKGTYLLWLLLIAVQAVTGFALWTPTQAAMQPLSYWLGGLAQVRVDHYLIMWLFIVTTMVHVYLSVAEGAAQVPLMFAWRATPPTPGGTGEERA
jgi:Ni/Fe-hydrogenase 1 B-type cytochrome subunit